MPIVSVTPLGSNSGGVGAAIGQIIDYLERGARLPEPNALLVGYYADTPTAAGTWRGRGVDGLQLQGPVDTEQFRNVLSGQHPHTGEQLIAAIGSSGRATDRTAVTVAKFGPTDELLNVQHAGHLCEASIGVLDARRFL